MAKHALKTTTTTTSPLTLLRRLRGWRRTGLTILALVTIGLKVDVQVAPVTVGPVTITPSFEVGLPVLGH
jgi:hypothetical protein